MTTLYKQRFEELHQQMEMLLTSKAQKNDSISHGNYPEIDGNALLEWKIKAKNLLVNVCGLESAHYKSFVENEETRGLGSTYLATLKKLRAIFLAAKEDFEGGHLTKLEQVISGEIFSDFILLAKHALKDGYKDVAAVLACAALEDALKRYASANGLDVNEKVMQEVVGALKAKGLVSGAQKSLLDAMPKIRDYAMHANWQKISSEDVSSVIGFVEQFLLSHF